MSMPSEAAVIDALRHVMDPEMNLGIVDLGLIREVDVVEDEKRVGIGLTLTSPMCPMAPQIMGAVRTNVERIEGVETCTVHLVWSPPWDPRTDATDDVKAELGIWD